MYEDDEMKPTDMYQDMMKLNMLYEEMCWDNSDILEFYPDYDNNTIIIRNKTMDEESIGGCLLYTSDAADDP